MSQSLPRSMKVRGVRGDKEVGVTCISFSQNDSDLFILGSESGCLFKCNLHAKGNPAGSKCLSDLSLYIRWAKKRSHFSHLFEHTVIDKLLFF